MSGPAAQVRVEGAGRLRRSLKRAGDDLDDLAEAHRAVAGIVAAAAAATAPKRTGVLASTVRGSGTRTRATVRAGYKRVPYAGIIHYGTPSGYPRHYAPQPWILIAAQDREPSWTNIYRAAVDRAIARVGGA